MGEGSSENAPAAASGAAGEMTNGESAEACAKGKNDVKGAGPGPVTDCCKANSCLPGKMKLMQIMDTGDGRVRNEEDAKKKSYAFWSTQPVPQIGTKYSPSELGPIEPDKEIDAVRAEPYSLPTGFYWDTIDLTQDKLLEEVYKLLNENYVEDDDNMFRFDYSPRFLIWALQPPGFNPNWHVGVRTNSSKKLVGFISGVPARIQVCGHVQQMAEINFLCVHKKLRAKRVTPVLIKEITRRVNRTGIFQAVYTAGVYLPTPIGSARYYHRSLNPKKLIETSFSQLKKNQTMQRVQRLYKLPAEVKTKNLRPVTESDFGALTTLLNNYLSQFQISPQFTEEETKHWFTPIQDVLYCYVAADHSGNLTDMISFYNLPSTVMNNPKHKMIKAAYSFYNVHTETPLQQLMSDALILAKNNEYDVFNCLNVMTNSSFLEELKFGMGDGNLQYYLYNFKCPSLQSEQIGLVLQ